MPKKKAKGAKFAFKLVMVGEPEVGIKSLLKKYVDDFFEEEYPSLGVDFNSKIMTVKDPMTGKDCEVSFQIWTIAGQSSFTNFRHLYLKKTHGAFLIFDLSRPATYEKLDRWLADVKEQSPTAKIIVIGNKKDIAKELPASREEILKRLQADGFFTTSIKTGSKFEEALLHMGQLIMGFSEPFRHEKKKLVIKRPTKPIIPSYVIHPEEMKKLKKVNQPYFMRGEELTILPKKKFSFLRGDTSIAPVIILNSKGFFFVDQESGKAVKNLPWNLIGNIQTMGSDGSLPDIIITKWLHSNRIGQILTKNYVKSSKEFKELWEKIKEKVAECVSNFYNFNNSFHDLQEIFEIKSKILEGNFSDFPTYQEAHQYGVSTYNDLIRIKDVKAPDLETAKAIEKGGFPDFFSYQKAQKIGVSTLKDFQLVKKYQAPDLAKAKLVMQGYFPDYSTYCKALKVGAKFFKDYKEVLKYRAPDYRTLIKLKQGHFPDYQTFQKAQTVRATTFHQWQEVKKYNAPDYQTVIRIKKGDFPDYSSLLEAQQVNAKDYSQLRVIRQYDASNYQSAHRMQLAEFEEKLTQLGRVEYEWTLLTVSTLLSIPSTDVFSILQELLENGRIEGQFNSSKTTFISARPTEREIQIIKNFVSQIRVGIPVNLSRIVEITGLGENRCVRIIKDLTSSAKNAGEYLDLEGVFIKNDGSEEALSDLLKPFGRPEIKGAGVPFFCQVDNVKHPATDIAYQCDSCARHVCAKCYISLSIVGKTSCPMCDGTLVLLIPEK